MSGLSVATCMERSVRFEQRPRMFEVHTVKEEGGEEVLVVVEGRGGKESDLKSVGDCRRACEEGRIRRRKGSVVMG